MNHATLIDWSQVHRLRDDVGADVFDEVLALFTEESATLLETLHTANTPVAQAAAAHALKGSAQTMGFAAAAAACADAEACAIRPGWAPDVPMHIAEAFAVSSAAFDQGRAAQGLPSS